MRIKRDKLDILFAHYIKLRDKVCQRCGGSGGLQAAHFYGRARKSVRYDESNCVLLCFGCHNYFHSHPAEFVEWYKQRLGDEYELLEGRMRIMYPKPDKKLLTIYYQDKAKEMEDA